MSVMPLPGCTVIVLDKTSPNHTLIAITCTPFLILLLLLLLMVWAHTLGWMAVNGEWSFWDLREEHGVLSVSRNAGRSINSTVHHYAAHHPTRTLDPGER
jgi:hypothetical protein